MKKTTTLVLTALLLFGFLTACAPENQGEQMGQEGAVPLLVEPAPLESPWEEDEDTQAVDQVVRSTAAFAFHLADATHDPAHTENFVISPFSVWLPLAALLNVTEEADRPALLEALQLGNADVEVVNRAASGILYQLTGTDLQRMSEEDGWSEKIESPIQIANALFLQEELTPGDGFLQIFADHYHGQAFRVDFADTGAVDMVNQWADEHTEGIISQIVEEFDPNTKVGLANAIYFSDRWISEFDPELTREDVFHAPGGESLVSFMCREADGIAYYENDSLQAVSLGMNSWANLHILLPRDGDAGALLADLDGEVFLAGIRDQMELRKGKILLPRFKIENDAIDLRDALEQMGIPFFRADGSTITGLVGEDMPLVLGSVVQKTAIEVREEGTTAAAVTVFGYGMGGSEPAEPFEMNCNSPFVFILTGETRGGSVILFLGIVNDPSM